MKLALPIVLTMLAAMLTAAPIAAQEDEGEPTATHIVMRYFKCSDQSAGIQLLEEGRAVADEMVEEGKFVGYGLLSHNWGDEWNVIDWFAVDGIDTFFGAFSEYFQRATAAADADASTEGDETPSFSEVCTEHKDNIYNIVQPPEGG